MPKHCLSSCTSRSERAYQPAQGLRETCGGDLRSRVRGRQSVAGSSLHSSASTELCLMPGAICGVRAVADGFWGRVRGPSPAAATGHSQALRNPICPEARRGKEASTLHHHRPSLAGVPSNCQSWLCALLSPACASCSDASSPLQHGEDGPEASRTNCSIHCQVRLADCRHAAHSTAAAL